MARRAIQELNETAAPLLGFFTPLQARQGPAGGGVAPEGGLREGRGGAPGVGGAGAEARAAAAGAERWSTAGEGPHRSHQGGAAGVQRLQAEVAPGSESGL